MRVLIGGVLGAIIGSVVWVGLEHTQQTEYPWFPVVVGFLTGMGVRVAATPTVRGAYLRGAFAAILALVSVVGARFGYAAYMQNTSNIGAAAPIKAVAQAPVEEESDTESAGEASAPVEPAKKPTAVIPTGGGGETIQRSSGFDTTNMVFICLCGIVAYFLGKGREGLDAVAEESHDQQEAEGEAPAEAAAEGGEEEQS
ncbi:MAG: hypothetical protein AAGA92_04060 [Planctomycetota bacterium]